MKRLFVILTALLVAGIFLPACGSAVPEVVPSPTVMVQPIEPSATPTENVPAGIPVSYDRFSLVIPTGLATGADGVLIPEARGESVAPWDVAPEHIQVTLVGYVLGEKFLQPQIFIYPAQSYADMQERGAAAKSLQQLQAVLAQSAMVDTQELPAIPFFNAPPALTAQVKVIPFQQGRGVRMVTQYAGGRAIINNSELIYHFEGLTDDGQNYVIIILPITAPGLPEDGQPGSAIPAGGVSVPDYTDMNANWMGYYGEVRQMFQNLDGSAFNPTLDQLDSLVQSILINP